MEPTDLLDLAEHVNTFMPLGPGDERIVSSHCVVWVGTAEHPEFNVVQRFRLGDDDVEGTVESVRALFAARGRPRSTWEIAPSATPRDLEARLSRLGLVPYSEPVATAMVLDGDPTPIETSLQASRCDTLDAYAEALDVLSTVFQQREDSPDVRRARAERDFAAQASGGSSMFVARSGGEIVAAARSTYVGGAVILGGAATLPTARGKGAYRALVRARHEDAIARGTPTLVIQAGAMSRPILSRLGFRVVSEIRILLDDRSSDADVSAGDRSPGTAG